MDSSNAMKLSTIIKMNTNIHHNTSSQLGSTLFEFVLKGKKRDLQYSMIYNDCAFTVPLNLCRSSLPGQYNTWIHYIHSRLRNQAMFKKITFQTNSTINIPNTKGSTVVRSKRRWKITRTNHSYWMLASWHLENWNRNKTKSLWKSSKSGTLEG